MSTNILVKLPSKPQQAAFRVAYDPRNDFYWTPVETITRWGGSGDPLMPADQINSPLVKEASGMGKLRNVLSRRILWFSRRRFLTAETQAVRKGRLWSRLGVATGLAVVLLTGLACSEDLVVSPETAAPVGFAEAPTEMSSGILQEASSERVILQVGDVIDWTLDFVPESYEYTDPVRNADRYLGVSLTDTGVIFVGKAVGYVVVRLNWVDEETGEDRQHEITVRILNEDLSHWTDRFELGVGESAKKRLSSRRGEIYVNYQLAGGEQGAATLHVESVEGSDDRDVVITGVAEGSAQWFVESTNNEGSRNRSFRFFDITVTAPPTGEAVRLRVAGSTSVEIDGIGDATATLIDGDAFAAWVEVTSSGANIVGLSEGSAFYSLEWGEEDEEQTWELDITVSEAGAEVAVEPIEVQPNQTVTVTNEENTPFVVFPVGGDADDEDELVDASLTDDGVTFEAHDETGVATFRTGWKTEEGGAFLRDYTVTVSEARLPTGEDVRLEVAASTAVEVDGIGDATATLIDGDEFAAWVEVTSSGANIVGLSEGSAFYSLEWGEEDEEQTWELNITVEADDEVSVAVENIEVQQHSTITVTNGEDTPFVVFGVGDDDELVDASLTDDGVTFEASDVMGVATFRTGWNTDEGAVLRDYTVTVTVAVQTLDDVSAHVGLGQEVFWSNSEDWMYAYNSEIQYLSGDSTIAELTGEYGGDDDGMGVLIKPLKAGTATYGIVAESDLDGRAEWEMSVTVHANPSPTIPVLDLQGSVGPFRAEGEMVAIRAILAEPAPTNLTLPLKVTSEFSLHWVDDLAYDWDENNADDHEWPIFAGTGSSITINSGEQVGVTYMKIKDDDLIEPASSELLRIELRQPNGSPLPDDVLGTASTHGFVGIAEGVCDRNEAIVAELLKAYANYPVGRDGFVGTIVPEECHQFTDPVLRELVALKLDLSEGGGAGAEQSSHTSYFDRDAAIAQLDESYGDGDVDLVAMGIDSLNFTPERGTPNFKLGDFAGLKGLIQLELTGFNGEGSEWGESLFRDFENIRLFNFNNWRLGTIPVEMFEGINPGNVVEGARVLVLHMDADEAAPGTKGAVIEDGAFKPFSNGGEVLQLSNFQVKSLGPQDIGAMGNLFQFEFTDFPNLEKLGAGTFDAMTKLTHIFMTDMPNLGDAGLPRGIFASQKERVWNLHLQNVGLEHTSLENLFGRGEEVSNLRYLNLQENQYSRLHDNIPINTSLIPHLRELHLDGNQIETFNGKRTFEDAELLALQLHNNPGAPFTVGFSLVTGRGEAWIVPTHRLPTEVTYRVYGQNLAEGFNLAVAAGAEMSEKFRPTRVDEKQNILIRAQLASKAPDYYSGITITPTPGKAKATVWFPNSARARENLTPVHHKYFEDLHLFRGSVTFPGAHSASIDLASYVSNDADEPVLRYVVKTSNESVASISVDSTTLTITGGSVGKAELSVKAMASTDTTQFLSYVFDVHVEDLDPTNFNLQIKKVGAALEEPMSSAVDSAQAFWNSVLMDVEDVYASSADQLSCPRLGIESPFGGQRLIDDAAIVVAALPVDGPSGTLAWATHCQVRDTDFGDESHLAILGYFQVDDADVGYLAEQPGGLASVLIHEIGHILGIGTTWYLKDPVGGHTFESDTRFYMAHDIPTSRLRNGELAFLGRQARAAFVNHGGTNARFSLEGTPIATTGGRGSFGVHWDETRLFNELMTPFHNAGVTNPFSSITYKSLLDLGWTVNSSFSPQPYQLPDNAPGADADAGTVFDLRNDFFWTPVGTIGRRGQDGNPIIPDQIESEENRRLRDIVMRSLPLVQTLMRLDNDENDNQDR